MPATVDTLLKALLAQASVDCNLPLGSLVVNDLRIRWQAGERLAVEDCLQRIPILNERPEALLELIYTEWLLREEFGPPPNSDEYRRRFPALADKLDGLLRLCAALEQNAVATLPGGTAIPANGEPATLHPKVAAEAAVLPPTPVNPEVARYDSPAAVDPEATRYPLAASPVDPEATRYPQQMPATQQAAQVSGYEILGELGRGGMGVVYKARHLKLGRTVALKMILAGGHASRDDLARFRTEAEAIARLQHPNIVQVHEVGEHNGKPFFSLEFCTGGSLDRKLKGTPLPPAEAARLVQTLAAAMQAAHEKNVIHRDLKPANVLLSEDGTPKITDFGLAKKLDDVGQTQSGAVMGTPSYMAPEQASGNTKEIGLSCDVYALGAILYELLTGRPPFKAATALETIKQVVGDEPVPPSRLKPGVPRDLETISLKCLHKEPGKRYASALALAEDLRRFQAGEPIAARPVGRVERGWRWCRRNPALAAALMAVAAALLLGTLVTSGFAIQTRREIQITDGLKDLRTITRQMGFELAADIRQQRSNAWLLSQPETGNERVWYARDLGKAILDGQGNKDVSKALEHLAQKMGRLMTDHPTYFRASFLVRTTTGNQEVFHVTRSSQEVPEEERIPKTTYMSLRLQRCLAANNFPHRIPEKGQPEKDHLGLPVGPGRVVVSAALGRLKESENGLEFPVLHSASTVSLNGDGTLPCAVVVLSMDLSATLHKSADYLCFLTDSAGNLWDVPPGFGRNETGPPRRWEELVEVVPEPGQPNPPLGKWGAEDATFGPGPDELARWGNGQFYPLVQLKRRPDSFWLAISQGFEYLTKSDQEYVQHALLRLTDDNPNLRVTFEVSHGSEVRIGGVSRDEVQAGAKEIQDKVYGLRWKLPIQCKTFAMDIIRVQYDQWSNSRDFLGVAQMGSHEGMCAGFDVDWGHFILVVLLSIAGAVAILAFLVKALTWTLNRIIGASRGFGGGKLDVVLPVKDGG
jgi:tRNA A-37 threonylcarbamoyl transferase component Bud32